MTAVGYGHGGTEWIRVPVGADAERFASRRRLRRVLLVVHNVTSATRLLDLLPLFRDDLRLQLLATCTGSSPVQHGVPELLADLGLPVLPWEQAVRTPVDLAVSASYGGQLEAFQGKLMVLSHGVGYNKRLAAPDTGHREPAPAPVFGLSPEWLLHEGSPLAAATVLSHPEQLARLTESCPQAAPTAVLAGDPCYDRLLASAAHRDVHRRAFGLTPGQRLVVLNSTWNPESLLGDAGADVLPELLRRLVEELPCDEYRLAVVLHPNIWHGHGPGQVTAWFDAARRAGAVLVPPLDQWRQALVAADLVLGDHGSVSYYAAALGVPVLLGAWPTEGLAPDSPVAAFVREAPRVDPTRPLSPQFEEALRVPCAPRRPAESVSSVPGRSAELLRRCAYRLLGLDEPESPALLDPLPAPAYEPAHRTAPLRVRTRVADAGDAPRVEVVRRTSDHADRDAGWRTHTVVDEETADLGRLALADIVVLRADADDVRYGPADTWLREAAERHPHASLWCRVTGPDRCTVRTRDGTHRTLAARRLPDGHTDLADPALYASALFAWLAEGRPAERRRLTVETGRERHEVDCSASAPSDL
ncbi:hypothetical protein [Streptomyces xiaopingdaonensis]|uniref:hypothetical protein n=1 Tax=Streptomyces xiaopingdaonensis TaxID=1565415 RepID=UPI000D0AB255|nr:hypothetical protein [Streptomyces xiaopingdaonensis]